MRFSFFFFFQRALAVRRGLTRLLLRPPRRRTKFDVHYADDAIALPPRGAFLYLSRMLFEGNARRKKSNSHWRRWTPSSIDTGRPLGEDFSSGGYGPFPLSLSLRCVQQLRLERVNRDRSETTTSLLMFLLSVPPPEHRKLITDHQVTDSFLFLLAEQPTSQRKKNNAPS